MIYVKLRSKSVSELEAEYASNPDYSSSKEILSGYNLAETSRHLRVTDLTVAAPSHNAVKEQYYLVTGRGLRGKVLGVFIAAPDLQKTHEAARPLFLVNSNKEIVDGLGWVDDLASGFVDSGSKFIQDFIITCPTCNGLGGSVYTPCPMCDNNRTTTLYKFVNSQR